MVANWFCIILAPFYYARTNLHVSHVEILPDVSGDDISQFLQVALIEVSKIPVTPLDIFVNPVHVEGEILNQLLWEDSSFRRYWGLTRWTSGYCVVFLLLFTINACRMNILLVI